MRSAELIALHLTPEAREELLALMRDIYQRFFLVQMEHHAVCETHEEVQGLGFRIWDLGFRI